MYGEKITSIQHLKEVITRHIEELKTNTGLLREVMYGVSTRINQCIAVDGAHFEQRRYPTVLVSNNHTTHLKLSHKKCPGIVILSSKNQIGGVNSLGVRAKTRWEHIKKHPV